jgi:hypothetical protein
MATHLKHGARAVAVGVRQVLGRVYVKRVRLRELREQGWVPACRAGQRKAARDARRRLLQAANLDRQIDGIFSHLMTRARASAGCKASR